MFPKKISGCHIRPSFLYKFLPSYKAILRVSCHLMIDNKQWLDGKPKPQPPPLGQTTTNLLQHFATLLCPPFQHSYLHLFSYHLPSLGYSSTHHVSLHLYPMPLALHLTYFAFFTWFPREKLRESLGGNLWAVWFYTFYALLYVCYISIS